LLEYGMGTSDTAPDSVPAVEFDLSGAGVFSYTRARAADDVIVFPEFSTDMASWLSGPGNLMTINEQLQPDGRIKARLQPNPAILGSATRFYARVRVVPR
jgi:hypothetical protein